MNVTFHVQIECIIKLHEKRNRGKGGREKMRRVERMREWRRENCERHESRRSILINTSSIEHSTFSHTVTLFDQKISLYKLKNGVKEMREGEMRERERDGIMNDERNSIRVMRRWA